jgi:hypothetical protein
MHSCEVTMPTVALPGSKACRGAQTKSSSAQRSWKPRIDDERAKETEGTARELKAPKVEREGQRVWMGMRKKAKGLG